MNRACGVAPMMKNGSRATTSQKQTRSAAGSWSCTIITRNGPPHITSTSPARKAFTAAGGLGDGFSTTSTPAARKAPVAWAA